MRTDNFLMFCLKKNTFNPDLALGDTIQKSTLSRTIKNIYIKHFTYKKKIETSIKHIHIAYGTYMYVMYHKTLARNMHS